MLDRAKRTRGSPYQYLRNANVRWGAFDLSDLFVMPFENHELDRYAVKSGDLLVCEGGEPGRAAIWNDRRTDIKYQKALLRVRPNERAIGAWILYALQLDALRGALEPHFTGSTIKHFPRQAALRYLLPLPPLAEQKRIVAKVEEVLAHVNAARDHLARIPPLLKRFRQAVLAAACSGELTQDWRNENRQLRSVQSRVDDIQSAEPQQLRVRAAGFSVRNLDLYDLPDGWAWIKNHCLAVNSPNAICAGPFGTIFKARDFRNAGVPIIFLRHVGEGRYITSKPGYMDVTVWNTLHQAYSVFGGELLVTKLGDPPGTACIYPRNIGTAMVTPDVMKMQVDERVGVPRYLMHFFNSPNCKRLIEELVFGVTRLRVDLTMFKSFPIPLPPPEEQHEIVRRVDALFALADSIEQRVADATARANALTQSTLAKAFRGELVATEAELAR